MKNFLKDRHSLSIALLILGGAAIMIWGIWFYTPKLSKPDGAVASFATIKKDMVNAFSIFSKQKSAPQAHAADDAELRELRERVFGEKEK